MRKLTRYGGKMRKLMPEQAQGIEKLAQEICAEQMKQLPDHSESDLLANSYWVAIDELTAKPGEPEYCEGCEYWERRKATSDLGLIWYREQCWHPERWPFRVGEGECPIRRWEDEKADTRTTALYQAAV